MEPSLYGEVFRPNQNALVYAIGVKEKEGSQ
jgi:hypothetical protein